MKKCLILQHINLTEPVRTSYMFGMEREISASSV